MTRDRSSSIAAFLVLCQIFCVISAQQCREQYSVYGMMLKKHIFKKTKASNWSRCVRACENDLRCQSMNYVISQEMCELNNRTKEARPEDFVPNDDRYYMKRFNKRVPLGSIPELPAKSCKEIKESEGGKAVSGRYWFDSIEPGKTILTLCNMITEDMDECSVSNGGCEQICINTAGSFICTCNDGYHLNVDKKTCQDIDECTQGSHDCLPNLASCINTKGSYNCACNHGNVGDGRISCHPEECQTYTNLSNADRNVTNPYDPNDPKCDDRVGPGWFRFEGAASTRMVTSCPMAKVCGALIPGWMTGEHPTMADGKVSRKVCFHYSGDCCHRSTNIEVRNCGSYFVYYLDGTPINGCNSRYCSSG